MKKGVIIIGLGNHVQNKIIPALNNLKIPIIGIITNNHEFKTDCKKYKNIKDLLLNNLDFKIILAHEPKNHIKLINDLPVSKSSILVEKPLLTNIQDIENYRNIFHKHEITEAMMYRFGKSFDEIKSFFDKNKKSITEINLKFLIPITFNEIKNNFRGAYNNKSNIIYEIGCYIYDFVWSLGLKPNDLKLEEIIFFSNGTLKKITGSVKITQNMSFFNINFNFGYATIYQNDVQLKTSQSSISQTPFFWGRKSEVSIRQILNDKEEKTCFLQGNLYERLIISWYTNKKTTLNNDLKSLERYKFILENLYELEKKVFNNV